ncbi:unnamed protein product [Spirodela intermedia]|uniref:Uncharacterized protein n=1 Tax=Spirodela intermedia TaxID=51605 RepID=A0A7I8JHT6_SPIIN|nr:unnamed protein product [Spirodela intermedia]CAA6669305.1 unnamed protein product [Spirodela intermedia]
MASFAYQQQAEDHHLLSAATETGPAAADPGGRGSSGSEDRGKQDGHRVHAGGGHSLRQVSAGADHSSPVRRCLRRPLAAPPPAAAVFFPSDYEATYFAGGISPDAGASPEFPPPPQGFNYSLPPLPPLPGRPSCTFPEEEHLFPWASSVNHYSL